MATFDQLSAEQRAILELVLKQGKSYEELAEMLGMPAGRVKELARESLVTLSPLSAAAVDEEWRGQIADYLLQQQSGPESTATRGHLRRSEGARSWSRSVLDSLEQLYDPANLPTIPDGDGSAPPSSGPSWRAELREKLPTKVAPAAEPGKPEKELSPEAKAVVRRRRLGAGAALGLAALLAILVWPVGLVAGGDDDDKANEKEKERPRQARRPKAQLVGQLPLQPVENARGNGAAFVAARGKTRQLIVRARLPATRRGQAYEVWLYNSDSDARSLGAQVTNREGVLEGLTTLPRNVDRYKFIDVSSEKVDRDARHSGISVLRGRLDQVQPIASGTQGGQASPPGTQPTP
jgi:hypothetical protein